MITSKASSLFSSQCFKLMAMRTTLAAATRFPPFREGPATPNAKRFFSQQRGELAKSLISEAKYEKENYQPPDLIKKFLGDNPKWIFVDKPMDVHMSLKKSLDDGKKVTVDFQLFSPLEAGEDGEGQAETTDFSVTVEGNGGEGVTFYCTTLQNDEKFRYMVGNVRFFNDEESRNSVTSFNGPEFEDLEDSLQDSFSDWLTQIGIDDDLCNFIDACSVDKENREYMNWLNSVAKFMQYSS